MEFISRSEETTLNLAAGLARELKGAEVLALVGNLGAGKTAFVRGLAKGLGVKQTVNSPTFVLMKNYKISGKIKQLVHADVYRLNNSIDLNSIGLMEYFNKADTVVVVEWADKIKKLLPKNTRFIKFKHLGINSRSITW